MRLLKKALPLPLQNAPHDDESHAVSARAVDAVTAPTVAVSNTSPGTTARIPAISSPHIVWSDLDESEVSWTDLSKVPARICALAPERASIEPVTDSMLQSTIEAEMLLLDRELSRDQHDSPNEVLDIDRLAAVIELVDASESMQGIVLSVVDKSGIIATLYAEGLEEQLPPNSIRADRLVWLSGS